MDQSLLGLLGISDRGPRVFSSEMKFSLYPFLIIRKGSSIKYDHFMFLWKKNDVNEKIFPLKISIITSIKYV